MEKQEIVFKGEPRELKGLWLQDKDTGDKLEFRRVGGADLGEALKNDYEVIERLYDYYNEAYLKTKEAESKECFKPIVSEAKLETLKLLIGAVADEIEEILEGVDNDSTREQKDL